jgi:alpha-1,2-rhamnosyltransferase
MGSNSKGPSDHEMTHSGDQDRIDGYIRRQVIQEEYFAAAFEMDPYTRVVYRRLRELYWTVSRILKIDGAAARPQLAFPIYVGPEREDGRIFIDATDLISSKATGIQRVVKELATNAAALGLAHPAAVREGRLMAAGSERLEGIDVREGDILFLPDAGWNRLDDYLSVLDDFQAKGGKIVGCLHDLFPLTYPALYTQGLVANFHVWTKKVLLRCDAIVAVSRSSAESFEEYAKCASHAPRAGMKLGWWRLGADFEQRDHAAPAEAVALLTRRAPFFLSVGTIEMRKGYPIALEAFERLWAEGLDANFIIVGRRGWNASALEARLRGHPEKGRRLFWLENATDADLSFLYREARAVILPSIAEGFGLPLVEAAHFGAPVIASDIDVFREIGGEGVRYFRVAQPESLQACIRDLLAGGQVAAKVPKVTWRDSTAELMRMLREASYQKSIG